MLSTTEAFDTVPCYYMVRASNWQGLQQGIAKAPGVSAPRRLCSSLLQMQQRCLLYHTLEDVSCTGMIANAATMAAELATIFARVQQVQYRNLCCTYCTDWCCTGPQ
ncbi:hypothetical protein ABBQ32_002411 [Trebouxia sp. C0010 RCD-2024]